MYVYVSVGGGPGKVMESLSERTVERQRKALDGVSGQDIQGSGKGGGPLFLTRATRQSDGQRKATRELDEVEVA